MCRLPVASSAELVDVIDSYDLIRSEMPLLAAPSDSRELADGLPRLPEGEAPIVGESFG